MTVSRQAFACKTSPTRPAALVLSIAIVAGILAASTTGALAHDPKAANSVDLTRLPLGDGHVSTTTPAQGWIYACGIGTGGGAFQDGPWIHSDGTFDLTAKAVVDGAVTWPGSVSITTSGSTRNIVSNGLPSPNEPTGIFPIQSTDDAYQYDRNPNTITAQSVNLSLAADPQVAATPHCIQGEVGIAKNGVPIFDGLDAGSRDAVAHEIQDSCSGHPQQSGVYHYHSLPSCLNYGHSKKKHSKLIGWALDGFPIFGPRGKNGSLLTDEDLDVCHGEFGKVKIGGKTVRTYHYHATYEYPYTLGCFAGTPVQAGPGMP